MSSSLRNIAKGGWHPGGGKNDSSSGSEDRSLRSRGTNRINNLMGRGDNTPFRANPDSLAHVSAPLSSLQDPSSFGPPPKHYAAGGTAVAALPAPHTPSAPAPRSVPARPAVASQRPAPAEPQWSAPQQKTAPKPPPRLPPRQNSHPDLHAPEPPPSYSAATSDHTNADLSVLNSGAVDRLGRAGVSVPGFGIGSSSSAGAQSGGHLGELQNRFARMPKPSEASPSPGPSQGTSWAQKQQAVQVAANFRKDPSSVSMADMRSTASTANNFRQRHGAQVAAGLQTANSLNQKYGASDKIQGWQGGSAAAASSSGGFQAPAHTQSQVNAQPQAVSQGSSLTSGKKAPPPPPKKRGLQTPESSGQPQHGQSQDGPPPIPLASKPK